MLLATTTRVLVLRHPPLVRNSLSHLNPSLPESEAGAESREVTAAALSGARLTQAEEGVTLDGALPQVFAALGVGQLEHKSVLLFPTLDRPKRTQKRQATCACLVTCIKPTNLVVVLHHDQRQSTPFKVQPSDFGPGRKE